MGEREGRVYSNLVSRRHYGFAHGIGRSGDISQVQPKAAGSSVMYKLVNYMLLHILHISGFQCLQKCLLVPLATGMSLALCMQSLKKPGQKYVLWSRIDQKSCLKAITAFGLIPLVVETILVGDELMTDLISMRSLMTQFGSEIACVLSTTSCFAPRCPDLVDEISLLCREFDVPHVINNAYGLQCMRVARLVSRAMAIGGRVDYVVQSCDKNLMVPVGGAIIASPHKDRIAEVAKLYPGRASSAPVMDVFITLLSMGETGYRRLLEDRVRLIPILLTGLHDVASEFGERILVVPNNSISFGITLSTIKNAKKDVTFFGSLLFQRCVSGARVVDNAGASATIGGVNFASYGSHHNEYPYPYMTAACALGLTEPEIHLFLKRLRKCFSEFKKKYVLPLEIDNQADVNLDSESLKNPQIGHSMELPNHRQGEFTASDLVSAWMDAYAPKHRVKKVKAQKSLLSEQV